MYKPDGVRRLDDDADVTYLSHFFIGAREKNEIAGLGAFEVYCFSNIREGDGAARDLDIKMTEHILDKPGTIKSFLRVRAGVFIGCSFQGLCKRDELFRLALCEITFSGLHQWSMQGVGKFIVTVCRQRQEVVVPILYRRKERENGKENMDYQNLKHLQI